MSTEDHREVCDSRLISPVTSVKPCVLVQYFPGPDLRGGGIGLRPSTNRGLPTKPFIFYFSIMIDAYETMTLLSRIVLVRPSFYSAGPHASHQLNLALVRSDVFRGLHVTTSLSVCSLNVYLEIQDDLQAYADRLSNSLAANMKKLAQFYRQAYS